MEIQIKKTTTEKKNELYLQFKNFCLFFFCLIWILWFFCISFSKTHTLSYKWNKFKLENIYRLLQ